MQEKLFNPNRKPDFLNGEIIVIDKKKSWSSFDVVNKIKFLIKYKCGITKIKIGHAGTLDPLATGVLVICTGKATKLISQLQDTQKEYLATIQLGAKTPSYDLETEIEETFPIDNITEEKLETVLKSFEGMISQTPPIHSAVWHNGKRAYKLARKGKEVELKKRNVFIEKNQLESFDPPFITIRVACSTGTYIRSLANDIGIKLNNAAFLYYLQRTRSGSFSLNDALKLEEFEECL